MTALCADDPAGNLEVPLVLNLNVKPACKLVLFGQEVIIVVAEGGTVLNIASG
jgi:hypothetical protein